MQLSGCFSWCYQKLRIVSANIRLVFEAAVVLLSDRCRVVCQVGVAVVWSGILLRYVVLLPTARNVRTAVIPCHAAPCVRSSNEPPVSTSECGVIRALLVLTRVTPALQNCRSNVPRARPRTSLGMKFWLRTSELADFRYRIPGSLRPVITGKNRIMFVLSHIWLSKPALAQYLERAQ
jgi:hypothetical protein